MRSGVGIGTQGQRFLNRNRLMLSVCPNAALPRQANRDLVVARLCFGFPRFADEIALFGKARLREIVGRSRITQK